MRLKVLAFSTRGPSEYRPAKEDRILQIPSLGRHVRKAEYNNSKYGDTRLVDNAQIRRHAKQGSVADDMSLFAVLDGHAGVIAAEYVCYRLPHEFVAHPKFASGDYESALRASFVSVHEAMIVCQGYIPEIGAFCSGTTVSAVVLSPTKAYFALLGDSPIMVSRKSKPQPAAVLDIHDHLNKKECARIESSNSLLLNHTSRRGQFILSWHPQERKELLNLSNNPRVGLAGVNVFGTLGDNISEPSVFNPFLQAISSAKSSKGMADVMLLPPEEQYEAIATFLKKHTAFTKYLQRSVKLPPYAEAPITLRLFFDLVLRLGDAPQHLELVGCPLRRMPDVKSEDIADIEKIMICSDGCISERVLTGSNESLYLRSIFDLQDLNQTRLRQYMQSFPTSNRLDDMSAILIHVNPPRLWGWKQILMLSVCLMFLIVWFLGAKLLALGAAVPSASMLN